MICARLASSNVTVMSLAAGAGEWSAGGCGVSQISAK
jgi:hypothetical protein